MLSFGSDKNFVILDYQESIIICLFGTVFENNFEINR